MRSGSPWKERCRASVTARSGGSDLVWQLYRKPRVDYGSSPAAVDQQFAQFRARDSSKRTPPLRQSSTPQLSKDFPRPPEPRELAHLQESRSRHGRSTDTHAVRAECPVPCASSRDAYTGPRPDDTSAAAESRQADKPVRTRAG